MTGYSDYGASRKATKTIPVTVERVNDAPTITVPFSQTTDEDSVLSISGVGIFDVDEAGLGSTSIYRVSLRVLDGRISLAPGTTENLTFVKGDGKNDVSMTFEGSLKAINTATSTIIYEGNLDSNEGIVDEYLQVDVSDLGFSGEKAPTTALTDSKTIAIRVRAVNDAPEIVIPKKEKRVDISGLGFANDLVEDVVHVTVSVSDQFSTVALKNASGLVQSSGAGAAGVRTLSFAGSTADVSRAIKEMQYTRRSGFDGGDAIFVTVRDQRAGAKSQTALIDFYMSDISPSSMPTIYSIFPHYAPVSGGSNVTFTGINFGPSTR